MSIYCCTVREATKGVNKENHEKTKGRASSFSLLHRRSVDWRGFNLKGPAKRQFAMPVLKPWGEMIFKYKGFLCKTKALLAFFSLLEGATWRPLISPPR